MDSTLLYLHREIPMWQVLIMLAFVILVGWLEMRKSLGKTKLAGEMALRRLKTLRREAEDAMTDFIEDQVHKGRWTREEARRVYLWWGYRGWPNFLPRKLRINYKPAKVVKQFIRRRMNGTDVKPLPLPDAVIDSPVPAEGMTMQEILKAAKGS